MATVFVSDSHYPSTKELAGRVQGVLRDAAVDEIREGILGGRRSEILSWSRSEEKAREIQELLARELGLALPIAHSEHFANPGTPFKVRINLIGPREPLSDRDLCKKYGGYSRAEWASAFLGETARGDWAVFVTSLGPDQQEADAESLAADLRTRFRNLDFVPVPTVGNDGRNRRFAIAIAFGIENGEGIWLTRSFGTPGAVVWPRMPTGTTPPSRSVPRAVAVRVRAAAHGIRRAASKPRSSVPTIAACTSGRISAGERALPVRGGKPLSPKNQGRPPIGGRPSWRRTGGRL